VPISVLCINAAEVTLGRPFGLVTPQILGAGRRIGWATVGVRELDDVPVGGDSDHVWISSRVFRSLRPVSRFSVNDIGSPGAVGRWLLRMVIDAGFGDQPGEREACWWMRTMLPSCPTRICTRSQS
jgi:hypothetical protein